MESKRKINLYIITLTIVLLISTFHSAMIKADELAPLIMNKPGMNSVGYTLTIRFTFPVGSIGLQYHQYIGLNFPKSLGAFELFLDTYYYAANSNGPEKRVSCGLTDSLNNKMTVTAVPSVQGDSTIQENNILYCRLDEIEKQMKNGEAYILTLSLNEVVLSSQFVKSIGLFTSTSNNSEKIIIDNIPVLGSLAI